MKRTWIPAPLALAVVVLLTAGSAVAQQEKTEGAPPSQENVEKATPDQTPPDQAAPTEAENSQKPTQPAPPGADSRTPGGRAGQSGAAPLLRLQSAMKKALVLSKEQEEAIDALFHDRLRMLKEARDPRRPANVSPEADDELIKLRDQIAAAREAGDSETIRQLREEFREKLRSRPVQAGMSMAQFVERVAAELTEEQRAVFLDLAKNLAASPAYPVELTSDLYVIWRAVLGPEVGASVAQKQEIRAILRSARPGTDQDQGNAAQTAKTTEEIRAKIFEKLTPEQREKVEAAIKASSRGASRKGPATTDQGRSAQDDPAKDKDAMGEDHAPKDDEPN